MVTCEELYKIWERRGNFCQKSEMTAKQIDAYIDYRKRHKLESYQINRCALYPFMMIEDKQTLHLRALKELRKVAKKKGGKKITRRLSIEIINRVNEELEEGYRITSIPQVRSRLGGLQHEINNVSHEVREAFDRFKSEAGVKSNNDLIAVMINCCSTHKDEIKRHQDMLEAEKQKPDTSEIEVVKRV